MATDTQFQGTGTGLSDPASVAFAITPGTSDLTHKTRALYVGNSGDLVVQINGVEVLFANVPDGAILPIRADKVLATGETLGSPTPTTTATGIVGLY